MTFPVASRSGRGAKAPASPSPHQSRLLGNSFVASQERTVKLQRSSTSTLQFLHSIAHLKPTPNPSHFYRTLKRALRSFFCIGKGDIAHMLAHCHSMDTPTITVETMRCFPFLHRRVQIYGGYGLGASTGWAPYLGEDHPGVDTSCRMGGGNHETESDRAMIFRHDVGPIGKWGYRPRTTASRHLHPLRRRPWTSARPDVVLIDSRFRVACF
jgi:hypothetical protein